MQATCPYNDYEHPYRMLSVENKLEYLCMQVHIYFQVITGKDDEVKRKSVKLAKYGIMLEGILNAMKHEALRQKS